MKRTLLKRYTPLRARRNRPERREGKLGIVRLKGMAMENLRWACYWRDKCKCQQCGKDVNPFLDPIFGDSYHMAHIRNKRMYGDTLENVRALCGDCHRAEHGNKLPRQ